MLKLLLSLFILTLFWNTKAQVKIGTDTLPADSSAALEIRSINKGFLGPRLTVSQIKAIQDPAEGLLVYNRYAKQLCYFNGTGWKNLDGSKAFPEPGDTLGGGLVFYLDTSGVHGLVCTETDLTTAPIVWYPGSFPPPVTGATATAVGTGASNTALIIATQGVGNYAAEYCDSLDHQGYTDWFLPSKGALGHMRTELHLNGLGNFSSVYQYWSSSENDQYDAWKMHFLNGSAEASLKLNSNIVRCVRAFSY